MKKICRILVSVALMVALALGIIPIRVSEQGAMAQAKTEINPYAVWACVPPKVYAPNDVPGKDEEKKNITYDDIEIINWTTRTFFTGSVDASSTQQPFNAWYDIVYLQLFGEDDPNVDLDTGNSDWKKVAMDDFTSYVNDYTAGSMTILEFNDKIKKIAEQIKKMINEAEGTKMTVNYILYDKNGTFTAEDKLYPGGDISATPINPSYVSPSGKSAVFLNEASLEAKTTETVKVKKSSSKNLTVSWVPTTTVYLDGKKLVSEKNSSGADGYQICYSTDKSMKKNAKTVKAAASKSKVTLKSLKKKTYYVKVRSFNKVGGKTYYGAWSKSIKKKI